MNNIKFKAWDKQNDMMREVEGIGFNKKGILTIVIVKRTEKEIFYEDGSDNATDYDLLQYSGVADSRGIVFCEGDILEDNGEYWEVKLYDGAFWVVAIGGTTAPELLIENDYMSIVGNRFENPELVVKG